MHGEARSRLFRPKDDISIACFRSSQRCPAVSQAGYFLYLEGNIGQVGVAANPNLYPVVQFAFTVRRGYFYVE